MNPLDDPYAHFASSYDAWKLPDRYDLLSDLLTKLIRETLPEATTVLDVGCGTGRLTREMVGRGYVVHGVDQSHAMIALARQKSIPGISYSESPIEDFQTDLTFDAAVATSDSFDHVLDDCTLVNAFRSVRRTLKSGGILVFDALRPKAVRRSSPIVQDTGPVLFIKTFEVKGDLLTTNYSIFSNTDEKWDRVNATIIERLRTRDTYQALLRSASFQPSAVLQILMTNDDQVRLVPADTRSHSLQEFHVAIAT